MPDALLQPLFVLLWSSGFVVGSLAIQVTGPIPLLAARFLLASSVAVPLALRHGRWRRAPLGRLAIIGLLLHVTQFGGIYGGFAPRSTTRPVRPADARALVPDRDGAGDRVRARRPATRGCGRGC